MGGLTPTDDLLAPWRLANPVMLTTGLQKTGTTLAGAVFAAAMGVRYSPEAAQDCCVALGWDNCFRNQTDIKRHYNFPAHGMFFSDLHGHTKMSRFFEKCKEHTLLGPEIQLSGETTRRPVNVLKADDMLPDALTFANFARAERLNMRLIFVTRHPLTTIRATQAWIWDKQARGEHKHWKSSVPHLASNWRRAARTYADTPQCTSEGYMPGGLSDHPRPPPGQEKCIFAAVIRYEDLMDAPHDTIAAVYKTMFPRNGGHFPGRPPPRDDPLPDGWRERVDMAMARSENHVDAFMRRGSVNETFTDEDLTSVGKDGGHELMAKFRYSMADVWEEPAIDSFSSGGPFSLEASPSPGPKGAR